MNKPRPCWMMELHWGTWERVNRKACRYDFEVWLFVWLLSLEKNSRLAHLEVLRIERRAADFSAQPARHLLGAIIWEGSAPRTPPREEAEPAIKLKIGKPQGVGLASDAHHLVVSLINWQYCWFVVSDITWVKHYDGEV